MFIIYFQCSLGYQWETDCYWSTSDSKLIVRDETIPCDLFKSGTVFKYQPLRLKTSKNENCNGVTSCEVNDEGNYEIDVSLPFDKNIAYGTI